MPEKMLVDSQIKRARPHAKVYTLRDGGGLHVIVHPNGKKYFQLRYSFGGRARLMQLGPWPRVSLEQARRDAQMHRDALRLQRDPITSRRLSRLQKISATAGTFAAVASQWLANKKPTWTARNYERQSDLLRLHLLPQLGALPIKEIDVVAVLSVLRETEARGLLHTARQCRQTAEAVFAYAIACGLLISPNPARDLGAALQARPETKHHAALKLEQVGPLLVALKQSETHPVTQAAIRLALLVGLRDHSLRHVTWADADLDAGLLIVPAQHMKGRLGRKKPFETPLPKQAIALLKELRPLTDRGPKSLIFPGTGKTGVISKSTLNDAIKRGSGTDATLHGSRSLLTDWAYECGYRAEAIEAQLAHSWGALSRMRGEDGNGTRSDQVRQAYLRSVFWEHRVVMLQDWANAIAALEKGKTPRKARPANVLSIRATG